MPIRFSSIKQSFPANRKLGKNKIPPRILLYDAIPQSGNTPPSKIRIAPSQKNVIRYHFIFLLNVSFSETTIFLLKSTELILPLHCFNISFLESVYNCWWPKTAFINSVVAVKTTLGKVELNFVWLNVATSYSGEFRGILFKHRKVRFKQEHHPYSHKRENFIRLHFITPWQASGALAKRLHKRNEMERLHKQGFRSLVKMWRKTSVLSEELLLTQKREVKPCGFVIFFAKITSTPTILA